MGHPPPTYMVLYSNRFFNLNFVKNQNRKMKLGNKFLPTNKKTQIKTKDDLVFYIK